MSDDKQRLGKIALNLLFGKEQFTDLHVESGQPIMMRRSMREWIPVLDDHGHEIIVSHHDIVHFVHASFEGDKPMPVEPNQPKWLKELFKRGALHHACNLGEEAVTGSGEATTKICRVRCTIQLQFMRESLGLVMRPLKDVPNSLEELGLPEHVSSMLATATNGLIIVTGPTGSGKSTTLAGMVNEVNKERHANILTLEDPIEFQHERKKSIINQRELDVDVTTFEGGVRDALRFVPDMILIGEIRDANTMRAALRAGESGHLVLSSTHAPTSVGAVRKMLSYLADNPGDVYALASCLVGVVAQALMRDNSSHGGNALAYELLDAREQAVSNAITSFATDQSGRELAKLESLMRDGQIGHSLPMIKSLRDLVKAGRVSAMRAAAAATSAPDKKELFEVARQQASAARPAPNGAGHTVRNFPKGQQPVMSVP